MAGVDRRAFLRLGRPARGTRTFSCRALYMRLVDADRAGTRDQLLERLAAELRDARHLRLTESDWLERRELRESLAPLLDRFQGPIERS